MHAACHVTLPPPFASMMIPHLKTHPRSTLCSRDLSQIFCQVQQAFDGTKCNSSVDRSSFLEFREPSFAEVHRTTYYGVVRVRGAILCKLNRNNPRWMWEEKIVVPAETLPCACIMEVLGPGTCLSLCHLFR